jgi:glycine cleavage system regulatory protein
VQTNIVFTFIGDDHPGLVDHISKTVGEHNGNWLESRLSRLAGKFSGIIQIDIEKPAAAALIQALEGLSSTGLSVLCEQCDDGGADTPSKTLKLQVLGLDRHHIVQEVSHALATRDINVVELTTHVFPAPMTGELMFSAEVVIEVPAGTDLDALDEQLELVCRELTVEIDLLPE